MQMGCWNWSLFICWSPLDGGGNDLSPLCSIHCLLYDQVVLCRYLPSHCALSTCFDLIYVIYKRLTYAGHAYGSYIKGFEVYLSCLLLQLLQRSKYCNSVLSEAKVLQLSSALAHVHNIVNWQLLYIIRLVNNIYVIGLQTTLCI